MATIIVRGGRGSRTSSINKRAQLAAFGSPKFRSERTSGNFGASIQIGRATQFKLRNPRPAELRLRRLCNILFDFRSRRHLSNDPFLSSTECRAVFFRQLVFQVNSGRTLLALLNKGLHTYSDYVRRCFNRRRFFR